MQILVVGGAGYIGAHMCKYLAEHGHEVVVCDDFSTGHRAAVRWGACVEASIGDAAALDALFGEDVLEWVTPEAAVRNRRTPQSTNPAEVRKRLAEARYRLRIPL